MGERWGKGCGICDVYKLGFIDWFINRACRLVYTEKYDREENKFYERNESTCV